MKKLILVLCLVFLLPNIFFLNVQSEEVEDEDAFIKEYDTVKTNNGIAFLSKELRKKQEDESRELESRLKREREELFNRLDKDYTDLKDKIEKEKQLFKEREEREAEDLKKRQEEERLREVEDKRVFKRYKSNRSSEFADNRRQSRLFVKDKVTERLLKVRRAARLNRHVEIISNIEDPVLILDADVTNTKTEYLQIKDIDLKYKIVIQNQTPKIINLASFTWERIEPFTNTITSIARETKFSKPLIPYEERVIEYNELDNLRNGEYFRIMISNVVFEDGTQWKNPIIANKQF